MAHRYLAGVLGLAILALAILSWRHRKRGFPVPGPTLLLGLVILQALLGMWTVTLLVKPLVVTAHLLGGMAIVALLWWQALHHGGAFAGSPEDGASPILAWAWLGLVLLVGQILLGGWTSSNYAALGCTEFPTCYGGRWWPDPDFREAFVLWRGLGVDYEHGVLDSPARTAIHLAHRLGAAVVALYLGCLAVVVIVRLRRPLGPLGWGLLLVLLAQLALGVANVLGGLPIAVAVAHNGTAAILLMVLISLIRGLRGAPQTR
jgi:cytochrome c oxidase assembly protein subunit 15